MGLGGISIWQLLIVLGIIILIFGTKKLRSLGGDLGGAVKGFKKAMSDGEKDNEKDTKLEDTPQLKDNQVSDSQVKDAQAKDVSLDKKVANNETIIEVQAERLNPEAVQQASKALEKEANK